MKAHPHRPLSFWSATTALAHIIQNNMDAAQEKWGDILPFLPTRDSELRLENLLLVIGFSKITLVLLKGTNTQSYSVIHSSIQTDTPRGLPGLSPRLPDSQFPTRDRRPIDRQQPCPAMVAKYQAIIANLAVRPGPAIFFNYLARFPYCPPHSKKQERYHHQEPDSRLFGAKSISVNPHAVYRTGPSSIKGAAWPRRVFFITPQTGVVSGVLLRSPGLVTRRFDLSVPVPLRATRPTAGTLASKATPCPPWGERAGVRGKLGRPEPEAAQPLRGWRAISARNGSA